MIKKLLVGILLVGILAMGASATTLKYWTGSCVPEYQQMVIDKFEEAYPDIKVEMEWVTGGNEAVKVTAACKAGDPPNVLMGYAGRSIAYAYQGVLVPLTGTLSEEDIEDFVPGVLDLYTLDGELMSYPAYQSLIAYLANKTLLEEAGIWPFTMENRSWTLDEWMETAKKINNPPVNWAACVHAKGKGGDYYTAMYFQIFGANLYQDGDYSKTTLNSEAGIRALQWLLDLRNMGWIPPGVAGLASIDVAKFSASGQIAMYGATPAQCLSKNIQGDIDAGRADRYYERWMIELPSVEGVSSPGLFPSPTNIVVFKVEDMAMQAVAIEFAKFINNPVCQSLLANRASNFGTRKSVEPLFAEGDHNHNFALKLAARVGIADLGMNSPNYLEVRFARVDALAEAFMGLKTPQEALDDFAEKVEEAYRKWKEARAL